MNLREEIDKIPSLGVEFGNPTSTKRDPEETEQLIEIAKKWALEMVGQIEENPIFDYMDDRQIGRYLQKKEIKDRIEESTK
jgi:hypothetical protein